MSQVHKVLTGCWRAQVSSEYIGATREAKPERTKIVSLRYSQLFSRLCQALELAYVSARRPCTPPRDLSLLGAVPAPDCRLV